MEAIAVGLLTDGIIKLISYLGEVETIKKHNRRIEEEIRNFKRGLDKNLELLTTKLPPGVSGVALDTLVKELQKANDYMKESLARGKFKTFWSAQDTRTNLTDLQRKLMASFQMAFMVTSLDVALEGHRSSQNFQGVMVGLFQSQKSDSAASQAEMRDLFRPLVTGQNLQIQNQEQMLQNQEQVMQTVSRFMNEMRATFDQHRPEGGISEKFFNDVMTAIRESLSDSPGESSGSGGVDNAEFQEASTYTEELNDLRAEISKLKASSSEAEKEAKEKMSSLEDELELEKENNAALLLKLKKELNTAKNQVTTLEEELQVAEKNLAGTRLLADDFLSLSAELARKSSEDAQVIKKLSEKVKTLGSSLGALGSQLEGVDSP